MPWRERSPVDERVQFISDYQRQLFSMTELCDRFGISRKTGYKWLSRYTAGGAAALMPRSSRPHHTPQATPPAIGAAIVALRKRYPQMGGKKILTILAERQPTWPLPAVSTANDMLKRAGLVASRRRRRLLGHPGHHAPVTTAPNDTWTADFKGPFRTRDAQLCYPLTICDAYSRYLLRCDALPAPTNRGAMAVFRRAFAMYGLPHRIRTDNGEPFAAASLGRLSRLSVWWIRLGILPDLIAPASPQQNGAHERMHRTLKAHTVVAPSPNRIAQQRRFRGFRQHYNEERPHEALGQRPPARLYRPSARALPERLDPVCYPGHYERRRVHAPGVMSWQSRNIVISTVLIGEDIGLEPIDDGEWDLHFGPIRLGRFDERIGRIAPADRRSR
jgi:putative transposase